MPIFIKDNTAVLYIHVPKTGGTYIQNIFIENGFEVYFIDISDITAGVNSYRTCSPQHYHASMLLQTLRLERFNYIFMTVRNPISRLKSEFLWNVRNSFDPNVWARHMFHVYKNDAFVIDNHMRPQSEFWLEVAQVYRIEDGYGASFARQLREYAGINITNFPEDRPNKALSYSGQTVDDVHFDMETMAQIIQFYSDDFTRFNYSPPIC
jgi:hypothetical protein